MQHQFSIRKIAAIVVATAAVLVVAVMPAAAQDPTPQPVPNVAYPTNTISVTGVGEAFGAPDAASLDVGIEVVSEDVPTAFAQANDTLRAIVDAITALGVANDDIRTSNLSIYTDGGFVPMMEGVEGQPPLRFRVSNTVNIMIRDVSQVEAVLDAAIGAGATNVYGLNFTLSDPAALEQEARTEAMDNARARAEQLAEIIGAQLGDVIVVNETPGGFYPLASVAFDRAQAGGGGAFVAPGQSSVQVQVQVTYAIVR